MTAPRRSREALVEEVEDLPPSAKLVVTTLQYEGALTQAELAEETRLAQRTVRGALTRLEEIDAVTATVSLRDARQTVYALHPALQDGASDA